MIFALGVEGFLKEYNKEPILKIRFVLPEVVAEELVHHYVSSGAKRLRDISSAERYLDTYSRLKRPKVEATTEQQLEDRAKELLTEKGFEIYPTPYKKIDFPRLIGLAVKHQPPFEETSDKGIKDALIVETIKDLETSIGKDEKLIVIGADGRFKEYLHKA